MEGYKDKKLDDDKEKMIKGRESGKGVTLKKRLKGIGKIKTWEDQRGQGEIREFRKRK